jgi:Trk K+ transport system NAD-binding subunit
VYREDKFILPDADYRLKVDDEVVIITSRDAVEALEEFVRRPQAS